MSIAEIIKARCEEGRLLKRIRSAPRGPALRSLYISTLSIDGYPPITAKLDDVTDDAQTRQRWLQVAAYLDAFIERPVIHIPLNSRKAKYAFMSRLEPPPEELWDIRCFGPKPGLRVFGHFASKDTFIVLTWDYREDLKSDPEYANAGGRCLRQWSMLFAPHGPFVGRYPNDYITGAVFSTDP
jgi:hypothetical protein